MKIAIATMHSADWAPLSSVTLRTKELYCERNGYSLVHEQWAPGRDAYQKLDFVQRVLPHFDALMWIDCDALICNASTSLDGLLAATPRGLIITADLYGINTGVFIVRNQPIIFQFLYAVLTSGPWMFPGHRWQEQAAVQHFLSQPPYADVANIVPQRAMNSYLNSEYGRPSWFDGTYQTGDFVLHLPGLPLARRVALASHYAMRATRSEQAETQIPTTAPCVGLAHHK
jgi:galactosyl transferase GMA12/MNN10 family